MARLRVANGMVDAVVVPAAEGNASPPLVFLHEGLGSIEHWRDFPARVRDACGGPKTLVYSRHGYGNSDPPVLPRPVTYMHDEAGVVLPSVMVETGIENPVLVGHSDGASIALIHAGAGHAVSALVLLAPHVFVEEVTLAEIAGAREAYESGSLRSRLARYHRDVDTAFRGWNDVWLSSGFRGWNIEDVLGNVSCPVLIIQGTADPYGTSAQVDAIVRGVTGPTTRVLLPGIGHAPHIEAPVDTLIAVTNFLAWACSGQTGWFTPREGGEIEASFGC